MAFHGLPDTMLNALSPSSRSATSKQSSLVQVPFSTSRYCPRSHPRCVRYAMLVIGLIIPFNSPLLCSSHRSIHWEFLSTQSYTAWHFRRSILQVMRNKKVLAIIGLASLPCSRTGVHQWSTTLVLTCSGGVRCLTSNFLATCCRSCHMVA